MAETIITAFEMSPEFREMVFRRIQIVAAAEDAVGKSFADELSRDLKALEVRAIEVNAPR